MKSTTFTFKDQDGIEVFVYKWEPESNPKAVVQISHGMVEHAKRYERVADALCKDGYICYANDHHGHGMTAGDLTEATLKDRAGVLGPNGWMGVVNSVIELTKIIKTENPNLPVFVLAHSWGSFVFHEVIQLQGAEYKGAIYTGSMGKSNKILIKTGRAIAKRQVEKLGPTTPSPKIDRLVFRSYNRPWKNEPNKTNYEWLSRDKEEVQKYVDDPWCGFLAPAPFFVEMFNALLRIWDRENEERIPKDLPFYILNGSLCAVSRQLKDIKSLLERFKKLGIKDVSHKFYEGARHEIFNEIKETREEVFKDIIDWLNSHLN
jgi:alpha-beta hydrolase superfamily lysophospholipase